MPATYSASSHRPFFCLAVPRDFVSEIRATTIGALRLGDRALRRVGLRRNELPGPRIGRVELPSADQLARRQRSICFTPEELTSVLRPVDVAVLEPLTLDAGSRTFSDDELTAGVADPWPFVKWGDWLVVARPFDLLIALRQYISWRTVQDHGAQAAADLFGRVVDSDVDDSLRRMSLTVEDVRPRTTDEPFTEIQARCDTDKVVVAIVLSDDFNRLDKTFPYTSWDTSPYLDSVFSRFEAIAEEKSKDGDQVLGMLVAQPAGRNGLFGLPEAEAPNLRYCMFSGADLDVVAIHETGEPLALWKYAEALDHLRDASRIQTFSQLDTYATYRGEERSLAAFREATLVTIAPGSGGPQRWEARAGRDRHGVPYIDHTVVEVERPFPDENEPGRLYHPTTVRENRLLILVANAPLAVWVAGPEGQVKESWDAVETVAYWVAELAEPLVDTLEELSTKTPAIQLEVSFRPERYWFEGAPDPGDDDIGEAKVAESGNVHLVIVARFRRGVDAVDNEDERLLVGPELYAVTALCTDLSMETSLDAESLVDAVAPLRNRKHLLGYRINNDPMSKPAPGRRRLVQESDVAAAREDLAVDLGAAFNSNRVRFPRSSGFRG